MHILLYYKSETHELRPYVSPLQGGEEATESWESISFLLKFSGTLSFLLSSSVQLPLPPR